MNYTAATGSSVHQMLSLIMVAKPLDIIVRQPTMKTMNKMVEQIAQMVKQISEVMAQNSKLIATLSKDGSDDCPLEAKKTKRPKGWGTKRDN